MRKIDKDGLLLCELQGKTFEISVEKYTTGSEVFTDHGRGEGDACQLGAVGESIVIDITHA